MAKSIVNLSGNITFRLNNSTANGGGVRAWYINLIFTGTSIFRDNSANYSGGGINVLKSTLSMNRSNRHNYSFRSYESFTSLFIGNTVQFRGGGVHTSENTLHFEGHNIFSGNSVQ